LISSSPKSGKRKQCGCKQSKCLKLYCECFAAQIYCENCECVDCQNTSKHEKHVKKAKNSTLERNPFAFAPKISSPKSNFGQHTKGCHCKKSSCLKKYCECFQAQIFCSSNCKCTDCKNYIGSEERQNLIELNRDLDTEKNQTSSTELENVLRLYQSESVRKVLHSVTKDQVLSHLCEVLLLASNEAKVLISLENHNPAPKTHLNSTENLQSVVSSHNTVSEEKSTCQVSPDHTLLNSNLSAAYISQERAILHEFGRFLKKVSEMMQRNVEQFKNLHLQNPMITSRTSTLNSSASLPYGYTMVAVEPP
jgi:hypothetical protein